MDIIICITKEEMNKHISFVGWVVVLMLVWLFFLTPILDAVTDSFGILNSYPLFLLFYCFLAYKLGFFLRLNQFKLIGIIVVSLIVIDIITPPILIDRDSPPSMELRQTLSSDIFVYTLFEKYLGWNHFALWIMTYIFLTALGSLLLVNVLGVSKTKSFMGSRIFDGVSVK